MCNLCWWKNRLNLLGTSIGWPGKNKSRYQHACSLTVLHIFRMVLVWRICLNIKTLYLWWSFPFFSWALYLTMVWDCKKNRCLPLVGFKGLIQIFFTYVRMYQHRNSHSFARPRLPIRQHSVPPRGCLKDTPNRIPRGFSDFKMAAAAILKTETNMRTRLRNP